jgi:hypothetical protein
MFSMANQAALVYGEQPGCIVPPGVDPTVSYVGSFSSLTATTCTSSTYFYSLAPVYGSSAFTQTGTGTATLNETSGCYIVYEGTLAAGTGAVFWFAPTVTVTCALFSGTMSYSDPAYVAGGISYPGCIGSGGGTASVTFSATTSTGTSATTGEWLPLYPGPATLTEASCGSTSPGVSVDSLSSIAPVDQGSTPPPTSATYDGPPSFYGSEYPTGIDPGTSTSTSPPDCYSFVVTTAATQSTPLAIWWPAPMTETCSIGCFQSTLTSVAMPVTFTENPYLPPADWTEYDVQATECNSSGSVMSTDGPYSTDQTILLSILVTGGQTCANVVAIQSSGTLPPDTPITPALTVNVPVLSCTPSQIFSGSDGFCLPPSGTALSASSVSVVDSNATDLLAWGPCGSTPVYDVPLSSLPSYTLTGTELPVQQGCTSYWVIPSTGGTGGAQVWIALSSSLVLSCQADSSYPFNTTTNSQFASTSPTNPTAVQGCYAPDTLWSGSTTYPVQLSVQDSASGSWQVSEWTTTGTCPSGPPPASATVVPGSGSAVSDIAFTPSGPTTMCFQASSGSPASVASSTVEVQYLPDYVESDGSPTASWQWTSQDPLAVNTTPVGTPGFGQQLCSSVIANGTVCDPGVTQATSRATAVTCPSGVPATPAGDMVVCVAQTFQGSVFQLGAGAGAISPLGPTTDTNQASPTFAQPQSTTVTWYEFVPDIAIGLTASPTDPATGLPTTLTATTSAPPGTSCSVAFSSQTSSTGTFPNVGNVGTVATGSTTQVSWSTTYTSSTAQTLYFQAELTCSGAVAASSAPVAVTWMTPAAPSAGAYPT